MLPEREHGELDNKHFQPSFVVYVILDNIATGSLSLQCRVSAWFGRGIRLFVHRTEERPLPATQEPGFLTNIEFPTLFIIFTARYSIEPPE